MVNKVSERPAYTLPIPGSEAAFVGQLLQTVQEHGYAINTMLDAHGRRRLTVKDFGAKGDGATDDTAAIQAAIDYQAAFSRPGPVIFPFGDYLVSDTLTVDNDWIALVGESHLSSRIVRDNAFTSGHTVEFTQGGGANSVFYGSVENLQFTANVAMTSGAHLYLNVCRDFIVEDCYFREGWIGIQAVSCGALHITDTKITTGTLYANGGDEAFAYVYFDTDTSAAIPRNGAVIKHCNFRSEDDTDAHVDYGVRISSADGIWFDQVHIGNTAVSSLICFPKNNTTQLSGVNLSNCWFDRCEGQGVTFDGETTATYGYHGIYNCFFTGGSTGTRGLSIQPDAGEVSNVSIADCFLVNWTSHGVYLDDCINVSIDGCNLRNVASAGGAQGIYVGSGGLNTRIQNNSSGFMLDGTTPSNAAYGLAHYGTNTIITGNDFRGNTTGSIFDGGMTGDILISDNLVDTSLPTVASATTITAPSYSDVFFVSGTTTITSVTAGRAGRVITLIFTGSLTFTDGSNLKLAGNFSTTADDTITLVSNGTNWYEINRSVN